MGSALPALFGFRSREGVWRPARRCSLRAQHSAVIISGAKKLAFRRRGHGRSRPIAILTLTAKDVLMAPGPPSGQPSSTPMTGRRGEVSACAPNRCSDQSADVPDLKSALPRRIWNLLQRYPKSKGPSHWRCGGFVFLGVGR